MFSNYFFRKTKIIHVKFNKKNLYMEELKMIIFLNVFMFFMLFVFILILLFIIGNENNEDIEIDALEEYYKGLAGDELK
jgi:cytoskeletal protein RodZ